MCKIVSWLLKVQLYVVCQTHCSSAIKRLFFFKKVTHCSFCLLYMCITSIHCFTWSVSVGVTRTKTKVNAVWKYHFLLNEFSTKPWMVAGQFLGDASYQYLNQTPFFFFFCIQSMSQCKYWSWLSLQSKVPQFHVYLTSSFISQNGVFINTCITTVYFWLVFSMTACWYPS
jgi:hypothetical protein